MNFRRVCQLFCLGLLLPASAFRVAADESLAATNLWQVSLPGYGSSSSPAVAGDGTIYLGSFRGWLLAVSPQGDVKWQFKAGREIKSSPAIADDGTVYFGSRDRNFYALNPDGTVKWTFATGGWVDASPAIAADGTVCFGSWDRFFYALTPEGKLKWKFDAGGAVTSSPALAADGTICFGSHDKNFYVLTSDGKLKWKFATGGEIQSSPALSADGAAYFSSTDGFFYAVNPDGTLRWKLRTGDFLGSSPVLDEQGNVLLFVNRYLSCISAKGEMLWQRGLPEIPGMAPVALADGSGYFAFPWRNLAKLDNKTGNTIWNFDLKDDVSSAPSLTSQGMVYIATRSKLLALAPTNAVPPAKSSWPQWRGDSRHTGRVQR